MILYVVYSTEDFYAEDVEYTLIGVFSSKEIAQDAIDFQNAVEPKSLMYGTEFWIKEVTLDEIVEEGDM